MTALDPGDPSVAVRPSATDDVPAPAEGVVALGVAQGSGYKKPPALVRRGDGQIVQLTPLLYATMAAIDGRRSYTDVAHVAGEHVGRSLHPDDVRTLVEQKLRPLGLVANPDGSSVAVRKANPLLAIRPRVVVSRPEVTRRITAPFAVLFTPALVAAVTIGFCLVTYWVLWHKGLASAAHEAFTRPGLLLTVFVITVLSAGFHEFGHASALRRGGGTPGAMGAGIYLAWPAFYTDVSDAYRLGRGARIRTDLGGLYFNAIIAVATFGVWLSTRWDAVLLIIATQILQMVRQLPPLVRFDGYHLLADVTGVPDLFHHIGPTLRGFLPGGRRRRPPLKLWVRLLVTVWVLAVVPIMAFMLLIAVVSLPRLVASAARSITDRSSALAVAVERVDVLTALAKLLAIVAIAVPVVGVVYLLVRTVRRTAVRTWQRTSGRPAKRALACVVAAALVAALVYAWWPRGNYRSIRANEGGTITDALPASWRSAIGLAPSAPAAPVAQGLQSGQLAAVHTVWPDSAGPTPTKKHPRLATILYPRSGTGPTWVFPFNRPAPPGPGDNQSMAIVTKDGSTVYDVAFALVWVTGDTALNRNEAYAFASCTRCQAVAVSFQVVLVVGHASVVAPQNISAAVNYNCIKCVTAALAVQLVVTLPNAPSGDVAAQLNALWRKIAAFGNHLAGLSFAQIKARIEDFERQILAIVRPLAASASASTATAANTGSASPGVSAAPGPAESAGASTSALPSASSTAPASASVAPPASTAPTPSTTAPSSAAVVTP